MKPSIATFLFILLGIHNGLSQDSAVLLSAKMLKVDRIDLSAIDGWFFKSGNDSSWSRVKTNTSDWLKLRPAELSTKYADKTGKVEGWFRFKFMLDTDFHDMPLGFRRASWAATDLYIDGRLITSFGNTGTNGTSFREYNPIDKKSTPFNLEKGEKHLIALHFVDYISHLPPRELKSATSGGVRAETLGFQFFLALTGPKYDLYMLDIAFESLFYRSIWVSVTLLLALLFWLLALQNATEKRTLFLIAIYFSVCALSNVTRFFLTDTDISFVAWRINDVLQALSIWAVIVMTFIITTTILNFKLSRGFKYFLVGYSLLGVYFGVFFDYDSPLSLFSPVNVLIVFAAITYLSIRSRKNLKGAQWAIAGGLVLSFFVAAILGITALLNTMSSRLLLLTCFYFSFPLSLVVYVSLRFQEIIMEVRENARRVVQMTEEKKEQAVKQQRILEEEVARQTAELRTTLENLKSTQAQLIQSEKMASLGELTAGIAHEIQNPLNFVNNFSEVNKELIEELNAERLKSNAERNEQLENEILNDIKENQEKINHHGRRADSIVKGMLQHSRTSSGQKELTDINGLADEYLRLAYHGFRAKEKSFSAKFETDFDKSVGKISVVPQDVGRVMLNLINNAFYAVNEKKQKLDGAYEPTVSISTKKWGSKIEIKVKDNGNGIPQKVLDKIFQPFFTTKPTGIGTGLGLSLSYDIVKAHGGEIKVESKEGVGSEFIIQLPF